MTTPEPTAASDIEVHDPVPRTVELTSLPWVAAGIGPHTTHRPDAAGRPVAVAPAEEPPASPEA